MTSVTSSFSSLIDQSELEANQLAILPPDERCGSAQSIFKRIETFFGEHSEALTESDLKRLEGVYLKALTYGHLSKPERTVYTISTLAHSQFNQLNKRYPHFAFEARGSLFVFPKSFPILSHCASMESEDAKLFLGHYYTGIIEKNNEICELAKNHLTPESVPELLGTLIDYLGSLNDGPLPFVLNWMIGEDYKESTLLRIGHVLVEKRQERFLESFLSHKKPTHEQVSLLLQEGKWTHPDYRKEPTVLDQMDLLDRPYLPHYAEDRTRTHLIQYLEEMDLKTIRDFAWTPFTEESGALTLTYQEMARLHEKVLIANNAYKEKESALSLIKNSSITYHKFNEMFAREALINPKFSFLNEPITFDYFHLTSPFSRAEVKELKEKGITIKESFRGKFSFSNFSIPYFS